MRVSIADHMRIDLCRRPAPKRRWANRLWICPVCHRAFVATLAQNPHLAPDGIGWSWVLWTPGEGPSRFQLEERPSP